MILFAILLITAILVVAALLTITGVLGGALLAIFGDLIVFAIIMLAVIRFIKIMRKK